MNTFISLWLIVIMLFCAALAINGLRIMLFKKNDVMYHDWLMIALIGGFLTLGALPMLISGILALCQVEGFVIK